MIDTIDKKSGHPRPKYDTTNWVDYINQVLAILNSLIMHGANFYQNAMLRSHISAEQIEFVIAELDLVIGYFQIHHLDFMLKCIED
ncbi:hypothetical protein [Acinetobacter johnsonii]|uniref:hypothetical protein n=1 Tax=Acinetobacter johnsonii TaxID=40214 RepID=UPI0029354D11|nr:hypothetical protein [Acinetobacter johnsonii]MDV2486821.1 hypothetical protein [Acinetobacter johnsonii]